MFSRGGAISRSFNAPHGLRINQAAGAVRQQASRLLRKSFSTSRLRQSSSEGALSRQPVVLKEGYLIKPAFFRFGGRKRRWCVLRKFSAIEASIDLYVDESKSRYKGSISLDKDSVPVLIVKNADKKRKMSRQCYIVIKVGKSTYQFTCDSYRELTEWCALIRQAMDVGSTFSGIVTEPASITDGPVNLKFTSNCITLLCPIKETSIKTWLLHKITSFGQCGGILTFEICTNCTDSPGSISRCSINLIQEKPTIILNILERAIRSNPNTNEIHYERSILGDIYHCGHDCTQPGRLMPSYSDPNIFSSGGSFSPPRTPIAASFEVHPVEQVDSGDSGLPGTPQPEELSSTGIPSPTSSYKSNVFRSPRHQPHHRVSPNEEEHENPPAFRRRRSDESVSSQRRSDEIRTSTSSPYTTVRPIANPSINHTSPNHGRVQYAVINHSASRVKLVRPPEYEQERQQTTGSIPYTPVTANTTEQVPRDRKSNYNKLKTLEESTEVTDDVIYDVPNCEPYPDTFSPSSAPARSHMDTFASKSLGYHPPSLSPNYNSHPKSPARSPVQSSMYTPGTDLQDREEDYEDSWIPPIPNHKYRGQPPPVKTKPINVHSDSRRRFQSSSDVLDTPMASSYDPQRLRRSTDDNALTYRTRAQSITHNNRQLEKTSKDFLQRLNEEEEKLTKVLAASRKEKNEELGEEARDRLGDLNRPYMFNMDDLDHDYSDPDMILETCSNLVDYQTRSQPSYLPNRMLTKEPTNNIKGYAYKVQIPFTNTQYDVPRRAAAAPDLRTMSEDAPPKPKRHISTEHLYYVH